jgi:hypothetical protein
VKAIVECRHLNEMVVVVEEVAPEDYVVHLLKTVEQNSVSTGVNGKWGIVAGDNTGGVRDRQAVDLQRAIAKATEVAAKPETALPAPDVDGSPSFTVFYLGAEELSGG